MSKFIAIALLFLIPLQFSWAVASQYCDHHEQGQAAQHFGHHTDQHDNHEHAQPDHQLVDDGQSENAHQHLHHGVSLGMASFWSLPTADFSRDAFASTNQIYSPRFAFTRIERPQWSSLA